MKKILITSLILSSLVLPASFAKSSGQPLDQMVAVVNDELITRSELNQAITSAKMQIDRQASNTNTTGKSLEKIALDQLINKKLQLQAAQQSGVVIADSDVEKAIQTIASQNNVSIDELFVHVKQEGLTPETYRKEIHDQIVLQKLQQREVAGKVSVTPEEVSAFMKATNKTPATNATFEYRLQDILIGTTDNPSAKEIAAATSQANAIVKQLANGTAASTIADPKQNIQSDDLGWRRFAEIPSAFANQVAAMKKGSVAGPISAPNGVHVLVMTDLHKVDDGSNPALADKKAVESLLLQKKFAQAVENWVSKLRSQAYITESV